MPEERIFLMGAGEWKIILLYLQILLRLELLSAFQPIKGQRLFHLYCHLLEKQTFSPENKPDWIVVIVDNDQHRSAYPIFEAFSSRQQLKLKYDVEPRRVSFVCA